MSLLQPKNSLILSKNHYGVPQDHHYSHKLNTILFPLLSLQTVYIKIPQKKWPASPLLQSYLNRQRSMIPSLLVWRTSKMFCSKDIWILAVWCDEGVYRIAKELQLLNPLLFENIFLGLSGFHMEKIVISCCGSYLQECGVGSMFVENEIFDPGVVQSVLCGGHYVPGKKGMMMLVETLQQLQFQEYLRSNPDHMQDSQHIEALQTLLTNAAPNESAEWKYYEVKVKGLIHSVGDFNNASCQKSNQFKFKSILLR